MLQQILDGQKRNNKEMNDKMETLFNDLQAKYDAIAAHTKKLDIQVAQTAEAVKRQEMESKKSFCNSAIIEKKLEDPTPKWKLSPPKYDCMVWPEEVYPEKESNRARRRRLFPKIIPKADNSGKFVVPCSINEVNLTDSLCDTGANVNIMSKKIADEIGLTNIQPSSISINYADSFSQTPYGFIPDVMVRLGNCSIPTDFQIVEMRESSHRPLILGTPFLSTVGAIFDFPNRRISFNKVNKEMFFPMCSTKKPSVDMVQENKIIPKPPEEEKIQSSLPSKDLTYQPKQPAPEAESKTMASPKHPPKGSIKDKSRTEPTKKKKQPKAFAKVRILLQEKLNDETLEGFKEKFANTLKLFPMAEVPRDKHGEIVSPAVNHPPDASPKKKDLDGQKVPLITTLS